MIENLNNAVEVLKQRIRFNLKLIHEVEAEIREILKEPVSTKRSEKLNHRFKLNKHLIQENNQALKLQKSIIEYLETYHKELSQFPEAIKVTNSSKSIEVNTTIEIKREDYFELTVNKSIEYNNLHPYFNDEEFSKELMNYFIKIEDYEMCARLSELKKE